MDIKKEIYDKNLREFRADFDIKHLSIVEKYLTRDEVKK